MAVSLRVKKEKKSKFTPLSIVLLVLLSLYCISLLYSLFWALMTSFKVDGFVFSYDVFGIPDYAKYKALSSSALKSERSVALSILEAEENGGALFFTYRNIWKYFSVAVYTGDGGFCYLPQMYVNSILYSVGCALASTVVPCITAYLCARYNFRFSKIVKNTVLIVMIIPIIGSMPSEISMAKSLRLWDTVWGLWIMKANFLGLYFLVFYDIFKAMPAAFTEAAKIDGASNMQILLSVGMPLAKNTILTVFLIRFVEFWNDYQTPMVFMSSYPTVAIGLNTVINRNPDIVIINKATGYAFDQTATPSKMAAVVMTALPVLTVFFIFQKKLMGNLTMGGVKG